MSSPIGVVVITVLIMSMLAKVDAQTCRIFGQPCIAGEPPCCLGLKCSHNTLFGGLIESCACVSNNNCCYGKNADGCCIGTGGGAPCPLICGKAHDPCHLNGHCCSRRCINGQCDDVISLHLPPFLRNLTDGMGF